MTSKSVINVREIWNWLALWGMLQDIWKILLWSNNRKSLSKISGFAHCHSLCKIEKKILLSLPSSRTKAPSLPFLKKVFIVIVWKTHSAYKVKNFLFTFLVKTFTHLYICNHQNSITFTTHKCGVLSIVRGKNKDNYKLYASFCDCVLFANFDRAMRAMHF